MLITLGLSLFAQLGRLYLSPLSIKIEDLPSRPQQLGETEQNDVLGGRGYRNPRAFRYFMRQAGIAHYRSRRHANAARGWHNRSRYMRAMAMRYR